MPKSKYGTPFKMKGHTLPGINQRSETKNLTDGRSPSSAFQFKSPMKKGYFAKHGVGTEWEHTHVERVSHQDGAANHGKK